MPAELSRADVDPLERIPLPDQRRNRILCGDALEEMQRLPDNCVDLIFTSPPYNRDMKYEASTDRHDWDQYFGWLFPILDECIRVLKHGGRLAINVQPGFSDYIPTHHIISERLRGCGLLWKGEILWEKNHWNCKYTAWGSWRSPSSPYLKYTWEFIEVFCKGTFRAVGLARNADLSSDEFKKWVYARWSVPPETQMKQFGHPAMFPLPLATRVIKLFSYRDDLVLDPFAGTGTTAVAAKQEGRDYLGIDISEQYCQVAEKRLGSFLL